MAVAMGWEPTFSLVKVGGSLAADRSVLSEILRRIADGVEGCAVIAPGGGVFADAVRQSQHELGYSDQLAHRLALRAMGSMAEIFAALEPRLSIARSIEAIYSDLERERITVWDPVALVEGHPDIAESWDVTSDSLAVWLASMLGAQRCVLYKSAPCPPTAEPQELARLGLVDRAFPAFAKNFSGEIVLRGPARDEAFAA